MRLLQANLKTALKRLQHSGVRTDPHVVEQPKVPVPVPTGPRAKRKFMLVPSRDAEIYPLLLCVSVGMTLAVLSLIRHTMFNPDVNMSRDRRETPAWERYNREEGKQFRRNRHHLATLHPNPVNTYPEAGKLHQGVEKE